MRRATTARLAPLLLLFLLLSQFPRASLSVDDGQNPLGECPYPCLPPPTSGTGGANALPPPPPPPLPAAQLPPGAGYFYQPPAGVFRPPTGGYYGRPAPPPPNPILPYFPWYYTDKRSASPRAGGSSSTSLALSSLHLALVGLLLL